MKTILRTPVRSAGILVMSTWCLTSALSADHTGQPPVTLMDDVVVPVPHEIFTVLDDLGVENWALFERDLEFKQRTDRTSTALLFGTVVAEGFLSVQAKDAEATRSLGPTVLELADLLGVKDAVSVHAKAIIDNADVGDWDAVRNELDKTQQTVRETMTKLRDEDLAHCVSMGGWLRGTEAVGEVILSGFSDEKAELLHQPDLVAHFRSVTNQMQDATRNHPLMVRIIEDLAEIETAMQANPMNKEKVEHIQTACARLIATIYDPATLDAKKEDK